MKPTARQLAILFFIARFIGQHSYPPSLRDISTEFGFASHTGSVHQICALEKLGLLSRASGKSRTMVVTDAGISTLRRAARDAA